MLTFILPAVLVAALVLPLFAIYKKGNLTRRTVKRRMILNLCSFAVVCAAVLLVPMAAAAAPAETAAAAGNAQGMGFLAAALATGLSALGAGIAVAAAAPAAIGAFSEDPKAFGKSLIFVALGEGVAIYGLLISILILNKI
ncbi:MAG: ATPase [Clostridiales bacterium]|uniref:ATP synthase F(0) sector subunit c n=1 Tax=Harryflintia acetispora TaxID=1849041 RepID=A0A9X8UI78_9FIRM|nr:MULTISPECIES: ATP synthase subunit C [Oscillospiraceae]PWM34831.1 MAG: ATPase [Clostridiales bacterium]RGB66089.1 ATPase [Harryflintia acetispora]TCL42715.1 V/A-type H+-transporting ATPase subunit K [Harryflintia acetispora]